MMIPMALVSPYVLGPPVGFTALVLVCRSLGRRRLAPLLRLRFAHNVLLAAYSFLVAWATLNKLRERAGVYDTLCVSSSGAAPYWYASKLWEWMDTVFLYASGKTPIALHLGHHATAASVVALNLLHRTHPTPLFDVGTALNAAVHTYQYAYYADRGADAARVRRAHLAVRRLARGLRLLPHHVCGLLRANVPRLGRRRQGCVAGHGSASSRPKLEQRVQPRHAQSEQRRLAVVDAVGEADGGGCVTTAEGAHDVGDAFACSSGRGPRPESGASFGAI